jgi:hypothetical protein
MSKDRKTPSPHFISQGEMLYNELASLGLLSERALGETAQSIVVEHLADVIESEILYARALQRRSMERRKRLMSLDVPQEHPLDPEDYFWTIWRDVRDERFPIMNDQWIEIRGTLDGNENYQGIARAFFGGQWELADYPGQQFPLEAPFDVREWRVLQPILDECPFCHSRDTEIHVEIDGIRNYAVVCHSCQAQGSQGTYYTDAVESWNSFVRREKS